MPVEDSESKPIPPRRLDVVSMLLLLLCVTAYGQARDTDPAPPENAAVLLQATEALQVDVPFPYALWHAVEDDAVGDLAPGLQQAVLKANAESLRLLERLADCKPEPWNDAQPPTAHVSYIGFRDLIRLVKLDAMTALRERHYERAVQRLHLLLDLCKQMYAQPDLISVILASGGQRWVADVIECWLRLRPGGLTEFDLCAVRELELRLLAERPQMTLLDRYEDPPPSITEALVYIKRDLVRARAVLSASAVALAAIRARAALDRWPRNTKFLASLPQDPFAPTEPLQIWFSADGPFVSCRHPRPSARLCIDASDRTPPYIYDEAVCRWYNWLLLADGPPTAALWLNPLRLD